MAQSPQRAGQPMNDAKTSIRQRQAAAQADPGHLIAAVRALFFHQRAERFDSARNSGPAQRIGKRIGAGTEPGLNELGNRVKAGAERHRARGVIGQRRVDDGQLRQHPIVAQADFSPLLRDVNHRIFRHFCPGTGGSRDSDKRQRMPF